MSTLKYRTTAHCDTLMCGVALIMIDLTCSICHRCAALKTSGSDHSEAYWDKQITRKLKFGTRTAQITVYFILAI